MIEKDTALYNDFLVRYRLPRPVSRSYETVKFSKNSAEESHRIQWCAKVTLRYLALICQANYLHENPGAPVNIPTPADFKLPVKNVMIDGLLEKVPVRLLQLAGIYSGRVKNESDVLHQSLSELTCLFDVTLAVVQADGFLVLTGPRLIYYIYNSDHEYILEKVPENTVLVYNKKTQEFMSLSPLLIWKEDSSANMGHLMMLKDVNRGRGFYSAEGMPGAPAMELEMTLRPLRFSAQLNQKVQSDLVMPPTRFKENSIRGDYHIYGVIWRGGTCDVYLAKNKNEDRPCVLKTFENQGIYDENFFRFLNEERYSSQVDHEQIVKAERVQVGAFGLVLKQKYIPGGSLGDIIDDNGVFTESLCLDITKQLLSLLDEIHASGIIHNDIKPDNIIIDSNNIVHIIDFGIAYNVNNINEAIITGTAAGSKGYMAPEIRRMKLPSQSSDLYSAGILCAQMLCGRVLSSYDEVLNERSIQKKFHSFLHHCLSHSLEYRFSSAHDALNMVKKIVPEKRANIALDIEGTLVTNYETRHPRPGLEVFLNFCARTYDRIFIYTLLSSDRAREVFDSLLARGLKIEAFTEKYEYLYWEQGKNGSIKDLRRCLVPLDENIIVDDMEKMVPEDQHHRHIHIADYNEPVGHDGGLLIATQILEEEM